MSFIPGSTFIVFSSTKNLNGSCVTGTYVESTTCNPVNDEGFGTIDAENMASINALFEYLKTNFDFIMIVSHLDVLRDFVDNSIEIKRINGYSSVNFV